MSIPGHMLVKLDKDAQERLNWYIAKYREEEEDWLLAAIGAHYKTYQLHGFTIATLPLDIHAACILEGYLDE